MEGIGLSSRCQLLTCCFSSCVSCVVFFVWAWRTKLQTYDVLWFICELLCKWTLCMWDWQICVLSNTKLKKEYRIGTFYRHKIIKEREMWTKNLIKLMISRERKTR